MITRFGKFMRNYRMDTGEILKDMADKLNVSSAFLSAVETGKRKVPAEWYNKLCTLYPFTEQQKNELQDAIYDANKMVGINVSDMGNDQRELVYTFARKIGTFSEDEIQKLIEQLKEMK